MVLTDIFGTFHLKTAQYTFFSSAHRTFSTTDHILGHKSSHGKFKIEIISNIFSKLNTMRLNITYKKKNWKNTWRLNTTLLNKQQVTEEIKREI